MLRAPHPAQLPVTGPQVPWHEDAGAHQDPIPAAMQDSPAMLSLQLGAGEPQVCLPDLHTMEDNAGTEPTIRDFFSAISTCSATLTNLNMHMGEFKADRAYVRQNLQKINERVE